MDANHLSRHQVRAVTSPSDQRRCAPVSRQVTAAELLSAALWYASQGLGVFPCEVGGKRPVTTHGFKSAATGADRIREWWRDRPYNIGLSTGYPGPDVLDVDVRPDGNGWPAYHRLKAAGMLAGAYHLVRTRAAGAHLWFAGTDQRCGSLRDLHIDFKSGGGYVLLPPSFVDAAHTDDGVAGGYTLIDDRPPTGRTFDWAAAKQLLCPARPALVSRNQARSRGGSVAHLPAWMATQTAGNRNRALYWAACRAAEANDQSVLIELVDAGVLAGLDRDEALRTVVSGARKVERGG